MDVNSNLLKLKLDMVYHDLPMEEAQKRFEELGSAPDVKASEPMATKELPRTKHRRKVVIALVPK